MSQFVYDLVYIVDDDGTANLLTVRGRVIPVEIKNLCNLLGFRDIYSDHIGWSPTHLVASIVEQCPALGIKVREVSLTTYQAFEYSGSGGIERVIQLALEGHDLEKFIS